MLYKDITVTMLASIYQALFEDDAYHTDDILEYTSVEELKADERSWFDNVKVILELMEAGMFTDTLFNKIREVLHGGYSYHQDIDCLKRSKDTTYLVFDLDFDEHYDYLYLDVNTLEIWKSQSAFIEFLLSR